MTIVNKLLMCGVQRQTWATWTGIHDSIPAQFETGIATTTALICSCLVDTDKILQLYRYNSLIFAKIVVTSANSAPTFGSSVQVVAATSGGLSCVAIDTGRVMVTYIDGSSHTNAVVLSISGTVITVNTPVVVDSSAVCTSSSLGKVATDQCVVSYLLSGTGVVAVCLSTSGTVITVRTKITVSANTAGVALGVVSATQVLVASHNGGTGAEGRIVSVSGNTLSVPTAAAGLTSTATNITVAITDSTHAIIAFKDTGDSSHGAYQPCSISGTTLSPTTRIVFDSTGAVVINNDQTSQGIAPVNATTAVIGYRTNSITYAVVVDTTQAYTPVQIAAVSSSYHAMVALDANRVLMSYEDFTNKTGYAITLSL